jgi:MYXO-CTERM domain-containing protein
MRKSGLALGAAALTVLHACGPAPSAPPLEQSERGDSPLLASFTRAADESGVPIDLLLALAYTESRFSQRGGEPSHLGGYGYMHLREGTTLERGALLTGLGRERLMREAEANIRGGALALAELAPFPRPRELAGWRRALEQYSGLGAGAPEYARGILATLANGAEGSDEAGRSLHVPAHSELAAAGESDGLGRLTSALTPDYSGASWKGPACCSSSRTTAVSYVVIHTCQGGFAGCWSWLKGCHDVSAHYVISSGGEVVQLVEEKLKAWHVGCLNSQSVGIEHEGYVSDPNKWFTEQMYCASAKLVKSICQRFGFPCDRKHVIGHNEANAWFCKGDHTDPGSGWNWNKLMGYVANGCGGPPASPPHPALSINIDLQSIAGQERDSCKAGKSKDIFDWRVGQESDAFVDVKNAGDGVAKNVEVSLWADAPYAAIKRWEILSNWQNNGAFKLNDTDGMQKVARDNPGASFKLWLGSISVGETKRVKLRVAAAKASLGVSGVDHPDLRAWVAHVDGFYDKGAFDAKPTKNEGGYQKQNGGDLRDYVQTDVLAPEVCGDGIDNDCNGKVDDNCATTSPPGPDAAPHAAHDAGVGAGAEAGVDRELDPTPPPAGGAPGTRPEEATCAVGGAGAAGSFPLLLVALVGALARRRSAQREAAKPREPKAHARSGATKDTTRRQ